MPAKNLIFIVFLFLDVNAWAQITSPILNNQNTTSSATIRFSVLTFREIVAQLKMPPLSNQANAFNANYNSGKGNGKIDGCRFQGSDINLLIIGTANNPRQLLRISARFFEENGKIYVAYGSTKEETSVTKAGTNYLLKWVTKSATNSTEHTIVLTPFKSPCFEYLTVKGRFVNDICGNSVILQGVNIGSHNWGYGPLTSNADILEIKKTNANTIRIPWYVQPTDPNQTLYTLRNLDSLIALCAQNQFITIVDVHDITTKNDANLFQSIALNWWKRPDVVNLIKKYEKNLILNIANEYGYYQWTGGGQAPKDAFEALYKGAITQLRGAGIRVPIMIDAPDGGNAHEVLLEKGQSLLNHDPMKNVIFSVHTYWARFKYNLDNAGNVINTKPNYLADVQNQIANIKNSNLCFVLGEVANQQEGNVNCQYDISDVYKAVLTTSQANNVSWLAWMWHYDFCPDRQMSNNNTFTNLSVFGNDIIYNTVYGLRLTTKPVKLSCL